ncbi:ribosomal protein S18-alanine N-acetyltransferase [Flexivirga caeni]|uniref:[Ribosomal protein bS18]-alanine N-acetyltransferase n=1 Tax=Flexivirga caeni TaxID=2294115 RepID=A0A3M9MBL0_9MICO|nr:ribosomal protein S18-alanine N-acetyltransferase [Flexivirga caeni]RNI22243.1 ribosomal-protein-alanine N-acetyltransferase [Flexivirga caeni]
MTTPLRELEWPDLADIGALDEQLFGQDAWSARSWWAELAGRPRRRYTVATQGERIVGYGGIDCAGATADVMTIGVDPAAQGAGVGRALLAHLLRQAREAGAEALLLEVRADNDRARNLYLRAGFEHIQTRRNYYRPDNVDAHILRADLKVTA